MYLSVEAVAALQGFITMLELNTAVSPDFSSLSCINTMQPLVANLLSPFLTAASPGARLVDLV